MTRPKRRVLLETRPQRIRLALAFHNHMGTRSATSQLSLTIRAPRCARYSAAGLSHAGAGRPIQEAARCVQNEVNGIHNFLGYFVLVHYSCVLFSDDARSSTDVQVSN